VPNRIQRKRTKGFKLPPDCVYVGRPTRWGNPFNFRPSEFCWLALGYGCRGDAAGRQKASVIAYRDWLTAAPGKVVAEYERGTVMQNGAQKVDIGPRVKVGRAPTLEEIRAALRGHDLACWCPLTMPDGSRCPCHADVLLQLANA